MNLLQYLFAGKPRRLKPLSCYLILIDSIEDQNKFEYLYNTYKNTMYYYSKRILNDIQLSEDAVHEAFLRIARNISKVEDVTSPETRSLVMLITRHAAVDAYRKRRKYFAREVYSNPSDADDDRDFIDMYADTAELPELPDFQGSEVGKALKHLGDDTYEVFVLRFGLDFSTREISEITGFSVSKIEKIISRGKKKLVQMLQHKE